MQDPILSIVICTYKRAEYLRGALDSVITQNIDPSLWEILVVENGKGDVISLLLESLMTVHPNIRYTCEERVGLSHARNRGWQEARGVYVHYIDDDVQVEPGWLAASLDVIQALAPDGYGGAALALYTTPKPDWFKDEYVRDAYYGEQPRALKPTEFIFGMNMAFRRDWLERIGGFDVELGMTGNKIAYAEDLAIQDAIRVAKPDAVIYYDPRITVRHLVRPEKMHWGWITRQWWARGQYGYRIMAQRYAPKRASSLTRLWITTRSLMRAGASIAVYLWSMTLGALLRNRARYPLAGHYRYEVAMRHLKTAARYTEKARMIFSREQHA